MLPIKKILDFLKKKGKTRWIDQSQIFCDTIRDTPHYFPFPLIYQTNELRVG